MKLLFLNYKFYQTISFDLIYFKIIFELSLKKQHLSTRICSIVQFFYQTYGTKRFVFCWSLILDWIWLISHWPALNFSIATDTSFAEMLYNITGFSHIIPFFKIMLFLPTILISLCVNTGFSIVIYPLTRQWSTYNPWISIVA